MVQKYRVKTIVTSSGERLPMLLGRDGLPTFEPTVFLSEVHARNRSSNTIDSYLRSVMVFLLFLDLRNINFEERLNVVQLLWLCLKLKIWSEYVDCLLRKFIICLMKFRPYQDKQTRQSFR